MKTLSLIIIVAIALSCNNNKSDKKTYQQLKKAAWLEGSWENRSPQGTIVENWNVLDDSTFTGNSFFIKEKDTLHSESIILAQRGDVLTYTPTVKGQNNGKPVEFKLTSSSEKHVTFENPRHDYPKKIVYHKITADSIVAEISGLQQGILGTEKYPMGRVE